MIGVGFEPTKLNAMDLKSIPFDRSGNLPNLNIILFEFSSTFKIIFFINVIKKIITLNTSTGSRTLATRLEVLHAIHYIIEANSGYGIRTHET
jgi:hypothetical protein